MRFDVITYEISGSEKYRVYRIKIIMTRREILKNGTGISIQGFTKVNEICKNKILENGETNEKIGIRIVKTAQDNIIKDNKIKGFVKDIVID